MKKKECSFTRAGAQMTVDTEKVVESDIVCSLKIYDVGIFKRRQNNNPEYRSNRLPT